VSLSPLPCRWLELDAQAKLNPARTLNAVRRNQLGVDDTEGGWVGDVERRVKEIDVVEEVEEVSRKLDFQSLGNGCRLADAHIKIPEAEARQRAVSAVVGVRGQQSLAEVTNGGSRIREVVEASARSPVARVTAGTRASAADSAVDAAATDCADRHGGQHACCDSKNITAAKGLDHPLMNLFAKAWLLLRRWEPPKGKS
jgi:hypothetical protein